ncbi:GGDEF domain-containing protein [Roseibium sp.]|uniref:GGDEF domain-containing protein n=1 Tax=Roseibium sp. TaxID=1936156 RepID=UPI003B512B81
MYTILVTVISVFISVVITTFFYYYINNNSIWLAISISVFVPILIAPWITWKMTKLIIKYHSLQNLMSSLANEDFLTGASTRRYFFERAETEFENIRITGEYCSILLLDVDRFKEINDQYGHVCGDNVLRAVGGVLKEIQRPADIVGRYGGEEFILFLSNTGIDSAFLYAEDLRCKINRLDIVSNNKKVIVTVSIGLADIGSVPNTASFESLINLADKALYKAKASGRDKTVAYENQHKSSNA